MFAMGVFHHLGAQAHWAWTIVPNTLDRTRLHRFEANNHDNINNTTSHQSPGELKTGTASRARVVGVVDGDVGHTELVEYPLATCGVAIAIASYTSLHIVIGDMCIEKSLCSRLEAEFGICSELSWFDELCEANAEHVCVV